MDDWSKRLKREEKEGIERGNEVLVKLKDVAWALGSGWRIIELSKVDDKSIRYRQFVIATNDEITIQIYKNTIGGTALKDKFTVIGIYDAPFRDFGSGYNDVRINISLSRSPTSAAKDIKRRLINDVVNCTIACNKHLREEAMISERQEEISNLLINSGCTQSPMYPDRFYKSIKNSDISSIEVTRGGKVGIKLYDLDPAKAIELIKLLS